MASAPKYRKRPVVVEAVQFQPPHNHHLYDLIEWLELNGAQYRIEGDSLTIVTLEDGNDGRAVHVASPGDWIIRAAAGEFYPCRDDIFRQTYEPSD